MKTPLTDAMKVRIEGVEVVSYQFARDLERDLRVLLLGTIALYDDNPWHENFAPETCAVFEKWKPEIEKMLRGE